MKRWLGIVWAAVAVAGLVLAGCGLDVGAEGDAEGGVYEESTEPAAYDEGLGGATDEDPKVGQKEDAPYTTSGSWVPVTSSQAQQISDRRTKCGGKSDCAIPSSGSIGHGDPEPWHESEK